MKMSVVHASRGRPARAKGAAEQILAAASGNHEIEYILVFDGDDPEVAAYRAIELPKLIKIEEPTGTTVTAFNLGVSKAAGDLILPASDHMGYPSNWDMLFAEATSHFIDTPFALHVSDGDVRPHYWSVAPVFSKKYYELVGYALYPGYFHYYGDVDFHDEAVARGMMKEAKHIKFHFSHYSTDPNNKWDYIYRRSEEKLHQDAVLYNQRKARGFKD